MEEIINAIANHIENWTEQYVDEEKIKNWGFVGLAVREDEGDGSTSSQPIPMSINGTGDREQVSLDDEYEFIYWIRWVSPIQTVQDDGESWGLKQGKHFELPLRIVIAHRVSKGENLVVNLAHGLPDRILLDDFESVFISLSESIDPDHETIYRTELGETAYELHRFDWNLYVINLNVEFVPCTDFSPPNFID